MTRHHWSRPLLAATLAGGVLLQGCVAQTVMIQALPRPQPDSTTTVTSPLRVQLLSGEILRFPRGATVTWSTLQGDGTRHDLALHEVAPVTVIPLDSVAVVVHYRQRVKTGQTLLANGAVIGLVGVLLYAISRGLDFSEGLRELGNINWIGY